MDMLAISRSKTYLLCCAMFVLVPWTVGNEAEYVSCGSIVKLFNTEDQVRLHSFGFKYGGGSGQQTVTGTDQAEDANSYWEIKAESGKYCKRGEPIRCHSMFRLTHLKSKKNLHSQLLNSPLSGNQEVSAYGLDGEEDTGDNWSVDCMGDYWKRDDDVQLRHTDTGAYLMSSGLSYGHPIAGQQEIAAVKNPESSSTHWRVKEGIFIHNEELIKLNKAKTAKS